MENKILISIAEAEEKFGITRRMIDYKIGKGLLTPYDDGKIKRIDKVELLQQMCTIISLVNIKGGSSKSTIIALAADYYSKIMGKEILVVDLDPQGNLSALYFDIESWKNNKTMYHFWEHNVPLQKLVCTNEVHKNVNLIPGNYSLAKLTKADTADLLIKKEEFISFISKYPLVFIDCPASLNCLTNFGVIMANYTVLALHESFFCQIGFYTSLEHITEILKLYSSSMIDILGIVGKREYILKNIDKGILDSYKKILGDRLLKNMIPEFKGIKERCAVNEELLMKEGCLNRNIFDEYNNDKTEMIKAVFEELNDIIYYRR